MNHEHRGMKHVNFRIPELLHAVLVTLAQKEGRSLNKQMLWMLEQQLQIDLPMQEERP